MSVATFLHDMPFSLTNARLLVNEDIVATFSGGIRGIQEANELSGTSLTSSWGDDY